MGTGTVSLTINFKHKPSGGGEGAMVAGVMTIKGSAQVLAYDLGLRHIQSFTSVPYAAFDGPGGMSGMFGSLNTAGSLGNDVFLKTYKGTLRSLGAAAAYGGTPHVGTLYPAGTTKLTFIAIGG